MMDRKFFARVGDRITNKNLATGLRMTPRDSIHAD